MEVFRRKNEQQVKATTPNRAPLDQNISGYFSPEEWAQAIQDPITLGEVRLALASIPGSLAETVIAQREER